MIFTIMAQNAFAEDYYNRRYRKASEWSQMFGMGVMYLPDWDGDDDFGYRVTPIFDFRWRDRFFISSTDGVGVNFYKGNNVKMALSAGYMPGRKEGDSDNLRGLGDISDAVSINLLTTIEHDGWIFNIGISQAITGDHDGIVGELSAERFYPIDDETTFSMGTTLRFGDEEYMQAFYGITAAQSAGSSPTSAANTNNTTTQQFEVVDLDAFENVIVGFQSDTTDNTSTETARDSAETEQLSTHTAGAGIKDIGVHMGLQHKWDDNWYIGMNAMASQLMGDAENSPLIEKRGSSTQYGGGLYLMYKF